MDFVLDSWLRILFAVSIWRARSELEEIGQFEEGGQSFEYQDWKKFEKLCATLATGVEDFRTPEEKNSNLVDVKWMGAFYFLIFWIINLAHPHRSKYRRHRECDSVVEWWGDACHSTISTCSGFTPSSSPPLMLLTVVHHAVSRTWLAVIKLTFGLCSGIFFYLCSVKYANSGS